MKQLAVTVIAAFGCAALLLIALLFLALDPVEVGWRQPIAILIPLLLVYFAVCK